MSYMFYYCGSNGAGAIQLPISNTNNRISGNVEYIFSKTFCGGGKEIKLNSSDWSLVKCADYAFSDAFDDDYTSDLTINFTMPQGESAVGMFASTLDSGLRNLIVNNDLNLDRCTNCSSMFSNLKHAESINLRKQIRWKTM